MLKQNAHSRGLRQKLVPHMQQKNKTMRNNAKQMQAHRRTTRSRASFSKENSRQVSQRKPFSDASGGACSMERLGEQNVRERARHM